MPTCKQLVSFQKESLNEEVDIEIQDAKFLTALNASSEYQQKSHVTEHKCLAPSQKESAGDLCTWVVSTLLTTNLTAFSGLELVFADVLI